MTIMPKASVKWVGDLKFQGNDGYGHTTFMDALKKHGGKGSEFTPMDLFLSALGGCAGIDIITMLNARGQHLTFFEVEMDAIKREEYPKFFKKISLKFMLKGELDDKVVERTIRLTMTKLCPIAAMLGEIAQLKWEYEIAKESENNLNGHSYSGSGKNP